MTNLNFSTTIVVNNSAKEVFDAINNVSSWWQGAVSGNTQNLNDEFTYRMKEFHFSKQQVVELIPNKKVVWLVTDSNLSFAKKTDEWTGTKIVFEIAEADNKTQLTFTHMGLIPAFDCYGGCSNGWSKLIQESLYSLITTGKGKDVF